MPLPSSFPVVGGLDSESVHSQGGCAQRAHIFPKLSVGEPQPFGVQREYAVAGTLGRSVDEAVAQCHQAAAEHHKLRVEQMHHTYDAGG